MGAPRVRESNAWVQRKGQSRGVRPSAGSLGVSRAQGRARELQRRGTALAPCHWERVSPPPYARRRVHPCQFQLGCRVSLRLWATRATLTLESRAGRRSGRQRRENQSKLWRYRSLSLSKEDIHCLACPSRAVFKQSAPGRVS